MSRRRPRFPAKPSGSGGPPWRGSAVASSRKRGRRRDGPLLFPWRGSRGAAGVACGGGSPKRYRGTAGMRANYVCVCSPLHETLRVRRDRVTVAGCDAEERRPRLRAVGELRPSPPSHRRGGMRRTKVGTRAGWKATLRVFSRGPEPSERLRLPSQRGAPGRLSRGPKRRRTGCPPGQTRDGRSLHDDSGKLSAESGGLEGRPDSSIKQWAAEVRMQRRKVVFII